MIEITRLDPTVPDWYATVDRVRRSLGAPDNPSLFPDYFLKVALPRIGGGILDVQSEGQTVGIGFYFPRVIASGALGYTLRFHPLAPFDKDALLSACQTHLGHPLVYYDPAEGHSYRAGSTEMGSINFGRPSEDEARAVRQLQKEIWNNPDDLLYPVDIHSRPFDLATSLVARLEGRVAGFLLGFTKLGGSPTPLPESAHLNRSLRIESQTMGVHPQARGRQIGYLLKKLQAEESRKRGIDLINWTVDPLLFPNSVLNFSRLRAVAGDFHPDHYPLRNELNRVPASRLSMTWVISSQRVARALNREESTAVVQVGNRPEIVRANHGHYDVNLSLDAPFLAFEIPAEWTELQNRDLEAAQAWRQATDRLFAHYVGWQEGRYLITAAGVDGEGRFLIGERVDEKLLSRIFRV